MKGVREGACTVLNHGTEQAPSLTPFVDGGLGVWGLLAHGPSGSRAEPWPSLPYKAKGHDDPGRYQALLVLALWLLQVERERCAGGARAG